MPIHLQKHTQHQRKAEQRRAAFTDERQRNTDDGHESHRHADVDQHVQKDNAGHAVGIATHECVYISTNTLPPLVSKNKGSLSCNNNLTLRSKVGCFLLSAVFV